jgi:hypothetical protein
MQDLGMEHVRDMNHGYVVMFDMTQEVFDCSCCFWEWMADAHGVSVFHGLCLKLLEL